jgi:hypothetical protein
MNRTRSASTSKLSLLAALALLLALGFAGISYGQTNRAALSGTVEDATGAKLPQAQVVITNLDTRISRT